MKAFMQWQWCMLAVLCLISILPKNSAAQESVAVPQQLLDDVQGIYLTFDSLKTLSTDIQKHTQVLLKDMHRLQRQLSMQRKGTRSYKVYRREYELKLAEYLEDKHQALEEMQALRMQTIDALDRILGQLNREDGGQTRALQADINAKLRRNDERIMQVKIEMLEQLDKIDDLDITGQERMAATKRFYQLQNNRLVLYQQYKSRVSHLLNTTSGENSHLPLMRKSLVGIHETLQHGFDWIEMEREFIELYAGYRQQWLKTDQKLTEVSGLIEQFSNLVDVMNNSNSMQREVEHFDRQLVAEDDQQVFLPTIPELQWPGRPEQQSDIAPLSPDAVDSLRRVLESQLNQFNE